MILIFGTLLVLALPVGYALVIASGVAAITVGAMDASTAVVKIFQPTQSFPLAGHSLLRALGQPDDGRRARQEADPLRDLTGRPIPRRNGAGHGGGVDDLRRGIRVGRGRSLGPRLDADPVAEARGLSGGILCRHHRLVVGDCRPDPAIDPADPVRRGVQRIHRVAVPGRHRPRAAAVHRLHAGVLLQRSAARLSAAGNQHRPARHPEGHAGRLAGARNAGVHRHPAARRHRHADRSERDGGLLRPDDQPPDVPRPDTAADVRRPGAHRRHHRRGDAGHRCVEPGRLRADGRGGAGGGGPTGQSTCCSRRC